MENPELARKYISSFRGSAQVTDMWCRDKDNFKPSTGIYVRFSPGRDVRVDLPAPFASGRRQNFLSWVRQLVVAIGVTMGSEVAVTTLLDFIFLDTVKKGTSSKTDRSSLIAMFYCGHSLIQIQ